MTKHFLLTTKNGITLTAAVYALSVEAIADTFARKLLDLAEIHPPNLGDYDEQFNYDQDVLYYEAVHDQLEKWLRGSSHAVLLLPSMNFPSEIQATVTEVKEDDVVRLRVNVTQQVKLNVEVQLPVVEAKKSPGQGKKEKGKKKK